MLSKKFLSIEIFQEEIKIGLFKAKNNILFVLDLQTFNSAGELEKYLREKRLKNLYVIGSLGGVHVIARSITLSSVGKVDFNKEVAKNIKEHIPAFAKDDNILIKYQIISTRYEQVRETVDVLVAIAREDAVEEYVEKIRALGLFPLFIDAGSTSLFLPFMEMYDKNVSTAIVNVKENNTDIVIVQDGFPYFVSELDIGKAQFSHSKSTFHRRLSSVFSFYDSGDNVKEPLRKAIITGNETGEIRKYLEKKLDLPVEIGDLENNRLFELQGKFKNISSYAHIIGLGLKKVYPALIEIDLIPDEEKEDIKYSALKNNIRKVSFAFGCLFSFLLCMLLCINLFYSVKLSAYETRVKGLEANLDQVYKLRLDNKVLKDKVSKIEPLIKNEIVWDRVLFELAKLTPQEVWFGSIRSNNVLKKSEDGGVLTEENLFLEGEAIEQSNIDRLLSRLEDSQIFGLVQIEKIQKNEYYSFKLKLVIK